MLSPNFSSQRASTAHAHPPGPSFKGQLANLLTIKQVTEHLNISRMTIYRLLAADPTFPRPIRIGRSVRIRADGLLAWVSAQEVSK
jgi:excisionase family DNA binding protein